MTVLGWIVTSILLSFAGYLVYNLIKEYFMNKKLNTFKTKNNIVRSGFSNMIFVKKAYQIVLATMLVVVVAVSGVFSPEVSLSSNKVLTQANQVGSKAQLLSLIKDANKNYYVFDGAWRTGSEDMVLEETDKNESSRDFIDTNTQVDGVSEADIIKTDGDYIYYASRYHNKINVVYINNDYEAEVLADIDLDNIYTDNIYLTDKYIIVIGYAYEEVPYNFNESDLSFGWVYRKPSGTVLVINRTTYLIDYKVETDTMFYDHRMINDQIYLISNKHVNQTDDELRPRYNETIKTRVKTSYLGYDKIYYYEDVSASSMTVITSINLSNFTYDAQAFIGYVSQMYVNETSIYTAYNYYDYKANDQYALKTQILKFDINKDQGHVTYQGGQILEGFINDSYWMDEYQGHLRVVTSASWPAKNRLYILKEDNNKDILNIVSKIDENLGLEGETVKSVRFNKTYAQVVTFLQTDPLYTIDLTNPKAPFIKDDPIIEKGYSTYMHVWNKYNQVIGFGFDADANGFITGLKLSAYDTNYNLPLQTYSFASNEANKIRYSFSEAIYNPKALMIDPDRGIIGFPINSYHYGINESYHQSSFVIFFIDFESQKIISEPTFISHEQSNYYMSIDRGIFIENIVNEQVTDRYIYTFSYQEIVVYHIESNTIIQRQKLNEDFYQDEIE